MISHQSSGYYRKQPKPHSSNIPNKPPAKNLRELRKQELLNNLVRVKEEVVTVKVTKTKKTYDKLMSTRGEIEYESSESSADEDEKDK
jgi:hypothetical protein